MRHFALASVLLLASSQLGIAKTINVTVGGPGGAVTFVPSSVTADQGDIVRFIFQQKNHTVTQSTLASPCTPMLNGFDSGFIPVAADKTADFQAAQLVVNNTSPIWAYCRQAKHCSLGMVFAVNPGDKFPAFLNAATATTTTSAPVATPSSGTDHKVLVGAGGALTFTPPNITAVVGDTITFEFQQKNHTVTASSFDLPCTDLSSGFDSGFQPVSAGAVLPTYTIRVNDTKPIWAFCKQAKHCAAGMVFAVNTAESTDKNFAAFQAAAKNGGTSGSSGSSGPSGYGSSATGRPSSSMAVVLGLFAAGFLL